MTTSIEVSVPESRRAKRDRARARGEAAKTKQPSLNLERLEPVRRLLRTYREAPCALGLSRTSPLAAYVPLLKDEVEALESWCFTLSRRMHHDGTAIRQALHFLRTFGRIMSLDFSDIPIEERDALVMMLALEHRWCYAAAGTTRDAFKIAIGRTGAR